MGTFGVISRSSTSFLDMMNTYYFNEDVEKFIIRRLMIIAIRSTNYIFCRRYKDWSVPELLIFLNKFYFTLILTLMFIKQVICKLPCYREVCICILNIFITKKFQNAIIIFNIIIIVC